jgi:FHS family glucose/mannose:H+ symporter-like MFS transporter
MPSSGAALNRGRLFVSACGALFVFGVVMVLLGTLAGMAHMRARLQLTDMVRQGNLQTLLLFGVFLATVVAGPLIDRFGNKLMLAVSALLATVALAGFAVATGYRAAQVFGFILGVGGGGLNMASNVLVSDIFQDDRGAKLNLVAVFFGVGALFIPLTAAAVGPEHIVAIMLAAAAISAGCVVAYLVLPFPPAREASGFSLREAGNVVSYPGVLLFAFLLFFESGNEAAFIGWTSTWAGGMSATARNATLVLALFQAMMMLGRINASRLLRVITEQQLVMASGVGALLAAVIVALAPSVSVLAAGVALGGLACASIYPTMLAIAGDLYRSFSGTVFGVLFAVGLSGGMAFPWSIGHLSQSFGFRAGMAMPVLGAAMICVLLLVIREPSVPSLQSSAASEQLESED